MYSPRIVQPTLVERFGIELARLGVTLSVVETQPDLSRLRCWLGPFRACVAPPALDDFLRRQGAALQELMVAVRNHMPQVTEPDSVYFHAQWCVERECYETMLVPFLSFEVE